MKRAGGSLSVGGGQSLQGTSLTVPGDTSSAAFWLAAGAIVPGAKISLSNILLNPTRTGFFKALAWSSAQKHAPRPLLTNLSTANIRAGPLIVAATR